MFSLDGSTCHPLRATPFGLGVLSLTNGYGYPTRLIHSSIATISHLLSGCIYFWNPRTGHIFVLMIIHPETGAITRVVVAEIPTF